MKVQDVVDYLVPYTQKVLIDNKADFLAATNAYLQSKGFWGNVISGVSTLVMNNFFWTFILMTVVPFVIKIILFVIISIFAPSLIVLEPFLDKLIDLIDNSLLSLKAKAVAKDLICMCQLDPKMLPVNTEIQPSEMNHLLTLRDDLENYSNSKNSLFRKGN